MINELLEKRKLNFKDIVEIQNILNSKADPNNPDWVVARTKVDYKLASILEMAELIESTPWKWWKGGSADLWNVKIEAIDMLHFLSSNIKLNGNLTENEGSKFLGFEGEFSTELFADNNPNNGADRNISFDIIKSIVNEEENYEMIDYIMKSCGLTADEISSIYVAKYTLNEIRWQGGYALDQYKKMKNGYIDESGKTIDGVEDNVFLKSLVDTFQKDENMTLGELRKAVFKTFE